MRPTVTFQHRDRYPGVGQQEGGGAADRACADHDDTVAGTGRRLGGGGLVVHDGLPLLGIRGDSRAC
jgi:hypothetical protein